MKSVLLFILADVAEMGGAWMVWQAVREGRACCWAGIGIITLGVCGFVATFQPDAHFGRILAAYGIRLRRGTQAWGMALIILAPRGSVSQDVFSGNCPGWHRVSPSDTKSERSPSFALLVTWPEEHR